jgi:hypothetical protein
MEYHRVARVAIVSGAATMLLGGTATAAPQGQTAVPLPVASVAAPSTGIGSPAVTGPDSTPLWRLRVYETTANHRLVRYRWLEGVVTDRMDLGGYSKDGVAALQIPGGAVDFEGPDIAAVRGRDNAIWYRQQTRGDGPYSAWRSLGGHMTSRPAIMIGGPGIVVTARGMDGAMWERARGPRGWAATWTRIGAHLAGGPAAAGTAVYVRTADHRLWTATRASTVAPRWSRWTRIPNPPGGPAGSEPGTDPVTGGLLVLNAAGIGWTYDHSVGWRSLGLGIRLTGAPAEIVESDGIAWKQIIVARLTDGRLQIFA